MNRCRDFTARLRSMKGLGAAVVGVFLCLQLPTAEAADGPVAYYPLNGSIKDSSGFGNHAANMGAVLTADRFGNAGSAFLFDGAGYLSAPDSNSLDIDTAFTLATWFRLDDVVSTFGVLAGKGSNSAYSVSIYYGGSTVCQDPTAQSLRQVQVTVGSGSNRFISGPSFPCGTGQWHHVAVTVRTESNGSHTAHLYVNGSYAATTGLEGSFANNTSPLGIGKDGVSANYFAGAIDDLRLYDRELSSAEITEVYNSLFIDGLESGSTAAWHHVVQ